MVFEYPKSKLCEEYSFFHVSCSDMNQLFSVYIPRLWAVKAYIAMDIFGSAVGLWLTSWFCVVCHYFG
jgi:hypothetical protein